MLPMGGKARGVPGRAGKAGTALCPGTAVTPRVQQQNLCSFRESLLCFPVKIIREAEVLDGEQCWIPCAARLICHTQQSNSSPRELLHNYCIIMCFFCLWCLHTDRRLKGLGSSLCLTEKNDYFRISVQGRREQEFLPGASGISYGRKFCQLFSSVRFK